MAGLLCLTVPLAWAAPPKTVTAPDGKAIRKVYVQAKSPQSVSSAIANLAQGTCLTIVPSPDEADAVLSIGEALPVEPGGLATPHVFGPSARQRAPSHVNSQGERNPSSNCDNQQAAGCGPPAGDDAQAGPGWPGNAGGNLEVSLASVGPNPEELWQPQRHSGHSWTHQLRHAVGCPVCPGKKFDKHKFKTYRNWMHKECPGVLHSETAHK
jgi:hypothetical protein